MTPKIPNNLSHEEAVELRSAIASRGGQLLITIAQSRLIKIREEIASELCESNNLERALVAIKDQREEARALTYMLKFIELVSNANPS